MSILDIEESWCESTIMKLTPTPKACKQHMAITVGPCFVLDCQTDEKYMLTQTKCLHCGKVFSEKKEKVK